jgi:hypothetical protein
MLSAELNHFGQVLLAPRAHKMNVYAVKKKVLLHRIRRSASIHAQKHRSICYLDAPFEYQRFIATV